MTSRAVRTFPNLSASVRSRTLPFLAFLIALALPAQRPDPLQHQAWGIEEGLPQNSVHALAQTPDGFLWVATEAGLARFDGAQFKAFTRDDLGRTATEDLCCLAVDAQGVLWVGSSFGLAALDHAHPLPLPDTPPFARTPIRRLEQQNGRIIATTDSGTFELHAGPPASAMPVPPAPPPTSTPVLRDRAGNLWTGSPTGLTLLTPGAPSAVPVPALAGQSILSLLQDATGDLWIGTETTGLHRLRHRVFHTLAGTEGTPVMGVAWSPGGLLLGTRAGELKLVPPTGSSRTLARLPAGITTLAVSSGTAWVGTTDGLYRVPANSPPRRYTSADGLPDDYIRSLAPGNSGDVWAGTAHGLAHLSGARVQVFTAANGLGGDLIGALLPVPGRQSDAVWVATEAGLSLLEGPQVSQTLDLKGSIIAGLAFDHQGGLWFATQAGALWRAIPGDVRMVLQLPGSADARHTIQSLLVDARDTLWIVRRDGVLSASIPRLRACTPQTCRALTDLVANWSVADGMPSAESLPSGFGLPSTNDRGELFFATRAGVAVAASDQAAQTLQVPVVIEGITVDDRNLDPSRQQAIPYGKTRLTVDYQGVSLAEPGRIRYRARLHGFDPDWVETATRRSASYTALPAGHYRFEVQATLDGQQWPDSSAVVSFSITPPVYRRWWFLALAGVLVLGIVFSVGRLRLAAERRRFALVMAERNRLAREVHDTLAQDLVSTGIQLDVLIFSLDRQPHERTLEALRTLRRRIGQALAEARESIGELRDPNIRLDLVSRLQRLVERKSTPSLPLTLDITGTVQELKPGVEKELVRIAGEAVENALRHAHASSISLHLQSTADALTLSIADTGRGFVPAEAENLAGHYGLRGMHERAEAIGAICAIASQPGAGTTVQVKVSYPRDSRSVRGAL